MISFGGFGEGSLKVEFSFLLEAKHQLLAVDSKDDEDELGVETACLGLLVGFEGG